MKKQLLHTVYLLTGSNDGDRASLLQQCREELGVAGNIVQESAVYETAAWGKEGLPSHLNQALKLETELEPENLLETIQAIEKKMGRMRQERWGMRSIDIDIIYFDDQVIHSDKLVVPHPLVQERRFALIPICDIAGQLLHPLFKKTNERLLAECEDPLSVVRYRQ